MAAVNLKAPAALQTEVERSLIVNGTRLFNSLLKSRRECNGSWDQFKRRLNCLGGITDRTYHSHYHLSVLSNSVLANHFIKILVVIFFFLAGTRHFYLVWALPVEEVEDVQRRRSSRAEA